MKYIALIISLAFCFSSFSITKFQPGDEIKAEDFNKVYVAATGASLSSAGSATKVNISKEKDELNIVNESSNLITIPKDGLYQITVYGATNFGTSNWSSLSVRINSSTIITLGTLAPTSSAGVGAHFAHTRELSENDILEFYVQTGSASLTSSLRYTVVQLQ